MLSVAALIVASSMVVGQAEKSQKLPAEVLKQVEEQWVGEWTWKATYDGETITGEESVQWTEGKTSVLTTGVQTAKGEKTAYSGLMGWDAVESALVYHGFDANKESFSVHWTEFSPTVWKGRAMGIYLGNKWESAAKLEFRKDSLQYEDTTVGKPWVSVATRKPAPVPPSNYEHLKGLELLVGSWEAKGDDGGTTRWTFKWAYNKNILENHVTGTAANGEVTMSNRGMMGWDEGNRRVNNWCFDKDGKPVTFLWAPIDDKTWETWWPGTQFTAKMKSIDPDTWEMSWDGGTFVFKRKPND